MRGLALLLVFAALGCAGRAPTREPASPPSPPVASLSLAVLGTNVAGLADGEAMDRLFAAPEVTAAGERLLGRLGQEPSLAPLLEGFTAHLFEQPALIQSIASLAVASPGISVDELTSVALARLSTGVDGPAFDAALDRGIDRLLDRPTVDEAFERMAETLVERAHIRDRLAALMLHWRPELEAAVGVPMTDERFVSRFEAHLADPARAAAMQQLFTDRMIDDPGVRTGVAALLDDDAFLAACTGVARTLLGSPAFSASAAAVLAGILDEVDTEELSRRVEGTLVTPELEATMVTWVDAITKSTAFGALAERLGAVLDDPNLQAELLAIIASASTGRTA